MADVENVIKAWDCCNPYNRKCKECPYEKDCYHDGISRHMVADAITLLKEQRAEIERLEEKDRLHCEDCAYNRICETPHTDKSQLCAEYSIER